MATALQAGSVYINIVGNNNNALQQLAQVNAAIDSIGSSNITIPGFKGLWANLRDFAVTATGLDTLIRRYIISPLSSAVKEFTTFGDQFTKMSLRTGISANALSLIGYAAEQSDLSVQELGNGLRAFARVSGSASRGEKSGSDAFKIAGIDFDSIKNLTVEEQFLHIAAAIKSINDPIRKADAAMKLFGRSGTALLPLLEEGKDGIEALMKEGADLGIGISNEDAENATILGDAIDRMQKAFRGIRVAVVAMIAKPLAMLSDAVAYFAANLSWLVRECKYVIVTGIVLIAGLAGVAGTLYFFPPILAIITSALKLLASGFLFLFNQILKLPALLYSLGSMIVGLISSLSFLLSPFYLIPIAIAAAAGALLYFSGLGGQLINQLKTWANDLKQFFGDLISMIQSGDVSGAVAHFTNTIAAGFGNFSFAAIIDRFREPFDTIRQFISSQITWFREYVSSFSSVFDGFTLDTGVNFLSDQFAGIFAGARTFISDSFNELQLLIGAGVARVQGFFAPITNIVGRLFGGIEGANTTARFAPLESLQTVITNILNIIPRDNIFAAFTNGITASLAPFRMLQNVSANVFGGVINMINNAQAMIPQDGFFGFLTRGIRQTFVPFNIAQGLVTNTINVFRGGYNGLTNFVGGMRQYTGQFTRSIAGFATAARTQIGGILNITRGFASNFYDAVSSISIGDIVRAYTDKTAQMMSFFSRASEGAKRFGTVVSGVFRRGIASASDFIGTTVQMIRAGNITSAFKYVGLNIQLIFEQMKVRVIGFFYEIYVALSPIIDGMVELFGYLWDATVGVIIAAATGVYTVLESIFGWSAELFNSQGTAFEGFWTAITTDLSKTMIGAWYLIMNAIINVIAEIRHTWNELVTGIMQSWLSAQEVIARGVGYILARLQGLDPDQVMQDISRDYVARINAVVVRGDDARDRINADRDAMLDYVDTTAAAGIKRIDDARDKPKDTSRIDALKEEIERLKREAVIPAKLEAPEQKKVKQTYQAAEDMTQDSQRFSSSGNGKAATFSAWEVANTSNGNVVTDILKSQKLLQIINNQLLTRIANSAEEGLAFA
jgi:hypothetical protein